MIAITAAFTLNRVIGLNGRIPWNIKNERRRFTELTTGNTVVMGRRTYEEIGKPLPGRETIVVSTTKSFDGCITVVSLEHALKLASKKEVFICGGEKLYEQSLDIADKLFITEIECEITGDAFFPKFDESAFKKEIVAHFDEELPYTYINYTRI